MASNDVEVEIKVPVDEETFVQVREKLKKIAKFIKRSEQEDDYFTPPHKNFIEPEFPYEWLSIRRRCGRVVMNYKHFYPENTEVTQYCDEFETDITNPIQVEKTFQALNFKKLITVEKQKDVYEYNDEFEISMDKVRELGYFVEIEAMKDFGSVEATRQKLYEFARKLGMGSMERDKRGYPFLLMKKKRLVK